VWVVERWEDICVKDAKLGFGRKNKYVLFAAGGLREDSDTKIAAAMYFPV
jgi:hypothetical protein